MEALLLAVAKRFRPDLKTATGLERVAGVADVIGLLYAVPLALLGLVWLIAVTDLTVLAREWPTLFTLLILVLLFDRLRFFIYMDIRGIFVSADGSLSIIAIWSGALLFGPGGLWLAAFGSLGDYIWDWRQRTSTEARWSRLRGFVMRAAGTIPSGLFALVLYEHWGGTFPLSGLSTDVVPPALYAILVQSLLAILIHAPFVAYIGVRAVELTERSASLWFFVRAAAVGLVLPAIAAPFAILAVGLHSQNGPGIFLFFVGGLLMGSLLARQLSQAVERSQQRSRELEKLEQLGHAIMSAPPDASTLPELLQEHVPGMFPSSWIELRRFPAQTLVRFPDTDDWPAVPEPVWDWLRTSSQARHFSPDALLPWDGQPAQEPLGVAPVMDTENVKPMGGIYIAPKRDVADVADLLPAVQSLAAQISSTLHSGQRYTQALAHQRVEQELALAGEIQAQFLPKVLPDIPGWQLAVTLEPARQTSGDFYDVILLPNGRLGILVADVADKGTGAALYMALSRTLIRTYAVEHHTRPDFALRVANNRILTDTEVDLFVTAFYGVLDPITGKLTYCNAGHNPPLLLRAQSEGAVEKLTRTGLPLGIFSGQTWEQKAVQLALGDVLVLYTDGVTEAQDQNEAFFGETRLRAAAQAHLEGSAQEIQTALMSEVRAFVGDAPQFDDIALMVLVHEA